MKLNNKLYDVLKWVALVALPALGTLYSMLASTWGFPFIDEIPSTVLAVELCLGALLGVSTVNYNKTNN